MRDLDEIFEELSRSRFRSGFGLRHKELNYLKEKGIETVLMHGRKFIQARIAGAEIPNDGRQTPMKNHPVFIAQHATATCCRKCLEKWHHIPKGVELSDEQIDYILKVIERWLVENGINKTKKDKKSS